MSQIRPATEADISDIATTHVAAWHAAYADLVSPEILENVTVESRLAAWVEWFKLDEQQIHVFEEAGHTLGFSRICPARDRANPPANYGELTHLYLRPSAISTGVGRQLFAHARSSLREAGYSGMLLWTIEGNSRARSFYESHSMLFDGAKDDQPEWLGEGVYEVRYVLTFAN